MGQYAEACVQLLLDIFGVIVLEHSLFDMRVLVVRHLIIVIILIEIALCAVLVSRLQLRFALEIHEPPAREARLESESWQAHL